MRSALFVLFVPFVIAGCEGSFALPPLGAGAGDGGAVVAAPDFAQPRPPDLGQPRPPPPDLALPPPPPDLARPPDLTPPPPADLSLPSCCGTPGDTGNNLGVGRYCNDINDCAGQMATLCATLANPRYHFCTLVCQMGGNCGTAATCICSAQGCACIPNRCIPNLQTCM